MLLLLLVEQMRAGRADYRLYNASAAAVQGAAGVKGSRAGQDYTGVSGAVFEELGLKLKPVHSGGRPQCGKNRRGI